MCNNSKTDIDDSEALQKEASTAKERIPKAKKQTKRKTKGQKELDLDNIEKELDNYESQRQVSPLVKASTKATIPDRDERASIETPRRIPTSMKRGKEVDQDETNAASSIELATKGNNIQSQKTLD